MRPLHDALGEALALAAPRPAEPTPLREALGRCLAEPRSARLPVPGFDHSAMDGYAVRAADVTAGVSLPVAFEVRAGARTPPPLPARRAARIFTGAPLPPGADTVVIQEATERQSDQVRFLEPPRPGQHVRRRGEELQQGDRLLAPGYPLGPGDIALLAAQGFAEAPLHRRPRVAILTTGDELCPPGTSLPPGAIYDSNGPMLEAAVREAGGVPHRLPPASDRPQAVADALREAARGADLVLSAGGVSVGDHDHVLSAWRRLGVTLRFWKVPLKPGKPLALGVAPNGTPMLALPGNPVSAWVTFELFVRPVVRAMLGASAPFRPLRTIRLARPLRHRPGRLEAVRARGDTQRPGDVLPHPRQASGALPSLAAMDWLLLIPAEAEDLPAGASVRALDLRADGGASPYFAP